MMYCTYNGMCSTFVYVGGRKDGQLQQGENNAAQGKEMILVVHAIYYSMNHI